MPLPIPNHNEDEKSFISRCMSNDTMKSEYPENKQRIAVCYSQFKRKKSNSKKPTQKSDAVGVPFKQKFPELSKNENNCYVIKFLNHGFGDERRIKSLLGYEGVEVLYILSNNIAKVESLTFCYKLWDKERILQFFNRYGKQIVEYESVDKIEKKEKHLHHIDIDKSIAELSGDFLVPYEFNFVALTEGKFNGIYYRAEDLSTSFETLKGKPITLDHSKSVRDVVGEVKDVKWNAEKKRVEGIGIVKDKDIAEKIHNGLIKGVSVEVMVDYIKTKFGLTAYDPEFIGISLVKTPACPVGQCGINVQ